MRFPKPAAAFVIATMIGQPVYADRPPPSARSASASHQDEHLAGHGTILIALLIAAAATVAALALGSNNHMPSSP